MSARIFIRLRIFSIDVYPFAHIIRPIKPLRKTPLRADLVETEGTEMNAAAQTPASPDPFWNPRPRADYANVSRRAYFAGYSDGYHQHAFNSGQHGDFSDYRVGFDHGRADAAIAQAEGR